MPAIVGNMWRCRVASFGWSGGPGLNTFYHGITSPTGLEAAAVVGDVQAFFTAISGNFPSGWSAQVDPTVDIIDPANGDLVGSFAVTAPGTVTGGGGAVEYVPFSSMLNCRILTDDIADGRRIKGHHNIGPCAIGVVDNGQVLDFVISTVESAYNADVIGGTAGIPLVWRRPRAASPGVAARAGAAYPVTGVQVDKDFAVLRSRRDG